MPTIPNLRAVARQTADLDAVRVPEIDVLDSDLETPFGSFGLKKRVMPDRCEYLLQARCPAANRLLTGVNDVFSTPPTTITAVDDADALRQAILLVWGRVNAGVKELDGMVRAVGAVAETRTKVGV